MARYLLAKGAKVNSTNRRGETPLSYAATWNQLQIVKLLLKSGADPNVSDQNGATPLMWAAQHADPEVIEALLKFGAKPSAKDAAGHTAQLHVSWRKSSKERPRILKLLDGANGARS